MKGKIYTNIIGERQTTWWN